MDAHLRSGSLPSVANLAERTDLSEPTVRRAIDQLRDTKWYVEPADTLFNEITYPKPPIAHVYVPKELLLSKKVEIQASIIYGILMAEEHFSEGSFTYVSLSQLTRRSVKTMRRAVRNLRDTRWLRYDQENHWVPIRFQLLNPVKEFLATAVSDLRRPKFLGETLNQVYLRLIADSNKFLYGGYCGELINPGTGKPLQLDVYYPTHSVAFEFNGPQHEAPTELYGPEEVTKQKKRDKEKVKACKEAGIELIIVKPEDLTLQTMLQKVGNRLPLRDLKEYAVVINFIEKRSNRYRMRAQKWLQSNA